MNTEKKELLLQLTNHNEAMQDLLQQADDEDFSDIKTLVEELGHELDEIEFANEHDDLVDDLD